MPTAVTILLWLSRLSSLFSILGSTAIIYMILSDRERKLARTKNRLMLPMSFFDVLSSLAFFVSKSAMPSDSGIVGAMGNSFTCTVQAFCIWLGLIVPMYNSSLNIYYMLIIKYSMNPERFSAQVEPFLHLTSILIPLATAITFTAIGKAVPWGNVCFGASSSHAITLISIISFCFLSCVLSMASICLSVKKQATSMRRYRFRSSFTNKSAILAETETIKQALLLTAAFIVTFTGPLVQSILLLVSPANKSLCLVFFTGIFYPLQGFWNFLLYVRQAVNRIRIADPEKCLIKAVREVVFNQQSVKNRNPKMGRHKDGGSSENRPGPIHDDEGVQGEVSISAEDNECGEILPVDAPNSRRMSIAQIASVLSDLSFDDIESIDST